MKLGNAVTSVRVINRDEYILELTFADDQTLAVMLKKYFDPPHGLARDIVVGQTFDQCNVTSTGAVGWPNGIEFCPDLLRQLAEDQAGEAA